MAVLELSMVDRSDVLNTKGESSTTISSIRVSYAESAAQYVRIITDPVVDTVYSLLGESERNGPANGHTLIPLSLVNRRMADNKNARDKQADDEDRRQRERELHEARDRADEPEPIDTESSEQLGDLDEELENHDYPTTTDELISAHGDREVETEGGSKTITEVLAPVDNELYESADDVRNRIQGLISR